MTPAARLQAAIEILDQVLEGAPAEKALTGWARRSRFAGSKDRAAVRDHVFSALRCLRSHAALGGARSGRGLIIGGLRDAGAEIDILFTGEGHAPSPLTEAERQPPAPFASDAERLDIPDWLWSAFSKSLEEATEAAAEALQSRAPVHLRVNLGKTSVAAAIEKLSAEGIEAAPNSAAQTALEVTEGARKIRNSRTYQDGFVELQDAASQAIVEQLSLKDGQRVLDYCAGGGGKSLAMAAQAELVLFAHDIDPRRMKDLPERARRAGVRITQLKTQQVSSEAPYDVVLCDAPCSGSGSWRRAPEGKWSLTSERLDEICAIQAGILDRATSFVGSNGVLAYATCSMLDLENDHQIQEFLARHPDWQLTARKQWFTHQGTDGFYLALLTRQAPA